MWMIAQWFENSYRVSPFSAVCLPIDTIDSHIRSTMCNALNLRLHITSSVHYDGGLLVNFFRMIAPHVCVQVVNTHKIIDFWDFVRQTP